MVYAITADIIDDNPSPLREELASGGGGWNDCFHPKFSEWGGTLGAGSYLAVTIANLSRFGTKHGWSVFVRIRGETIVSVRTLRGLAGVTC